MKKVGKNSKLVERVTHPTIAQIYIKCHKLHNF